MKEKKKKTSGVSSRPSVSFSVTSYLLLNFLSLLASFLICKVGMMIINSYFLELLGGSVGLEKVLSTAAGTSWALCKW